MQQMNMYVYICSEPGLWTVGHYMPSGKWIAASDHSSTDDAADRAAYLNGDSRVLHDRIAAQHDHIEDGAKALEPANERIAELEATAERRLQELRQRNMQIAVLQNIVSARRDEITELEQQLAAALAVIERAGSMSDGALYAEGCKP